MKPEELANLVFELYRKIRNREGVTAPQNNKGNQVMCADESSFFMSFSRRNARRMSMQSLMIGKVA
jgi:hypothetical protein